MADEDDPPRRMPTGDLGTSLFMKELKKTEGDLPWALEGRRWSVR